MSERKARRIELYGAEHYPERYSNQRLLRGLKRLVVLPLDQLRGLPLVSVAEYGPGIYYLWVGPSLEYIGRSVNLGYRFSQHRKTKHFTHATFLRVANECLDRYEGAYVWHYAPPQNRTRHG